MLKIFFHVLAITIAINLVLSKDYLNMIISYSVFSLFAAIIYFLNFAPDVAIAEIAIGSAIVPLIFIISVSKQRNFLVAGEIFDNDDKESVEYVLTILETFCEVNNLKLKIVKNVDELVMNGVFRKINIDLVVNKLQSTSGYFFIGKESSLLMHQLDTMTAENFTVNVILAPDVDMIRGDN